MKKIIFPVLTAAGFFVFMRFDLLREIPGFHCESFGCIGNGIFYMLIGGLAIPLLFAVQGLFHPKGGRIKNALVWGGISFACMLCAFSLIYVLHELDVAKAVKESEEADKVFQEKRVEGRE